MEYNDFKCEDVITKDSVMCVDSLYDNIDIELE